MERPNVQPVSPPAGGRWQPIFLAAALLGAGGVSLAAWRWLGGDEGSGPHSARLQLKDEPVLQTPPALSTGAARLHDGDEVIGVSFGGRHRAYALAALVPFREHVVNDLLGAVPVTITYCDRTDCAAVFTGPEGGGPLDLAVGGYVGRYDVGSLLLRSGSTRYRQDTQQPLERDAAAFPYPRAAFERTTWKKWREAHPDTDVYVGEQPTPAKDPRDE